MAPAANVKFPGPIPQPNPLLKSDQPAKPVRVPEQERVSVLFVDRLNQTRSVLAQAIAETIRLLTLNTTRHCPFICLDSAGHDAEKISQSYFDNREPSYADSVALEALFANRHSREEEDVKTRLLARKSRRLTAADFGRYDFILAFDDSGLERIREFRRRQGVVNPTARVAQLGDHDILTPGRRIKKSDYYRTINEIRNALEQWLRMNTNWEPLRGPIDGINLPYRSLQCMVPGIRHNPRMLQTLHELYDDCTVSLDEPVAIDADRLLTVTAKAADLEEAFEFIKERLQTH